MPEASPSSSKAGFLGKIAAGAAVVFGFLLSHGSEEVGKWLGFSLLLPIAILIATCWAATKLLDTGHKFLNQAVGIPAGQGLYMLIPVIVFGSAALPLVAIDIVIIAAGVIWLFARPGIAPLLLLLAYEAIALAMHLYGAFSGNVADNLLKGLVSAILIRIYAIVILYDGYRKMKAVPSTL